MLQSSVEIAKNVYQRECFLLSGRARPLSAKTEPVLEAALSPTQPVLLSDLVAQAPAKPLLRPQTAHKRTRAAVQRVPKDIGTIGG